MFFCACKPTDEIQYKLYMSHDKIYEVEIPADFDEETSIGSVLIFKQEKSHAYLSIIEMNEDDTFGQVVENNKREDAGFTYSITEQTDTSCFYKITKGTSIWSANELYIMKTIENHNYIIILSSDIIGQSKLVSIIRHIQQSLRPHSLEIELQVGDECLDDDDEFTVRNTDYYSISYPKAWSVLVNPNQMTDAYIGDSEGKIGCTILFFDTDLSIAEINAEANTNMKEVGAVVTSEKKTVVNGMPCYRAVYEFSLGDMEVKQISYMFKSGNTMYSVKFGNNREEINSNLPMIEKIISSFIIK